MNRAGGLHAEAGAGDHERKEQRLHVPIVEATHWAGPLYFIFRHREPGREIRIFVDADDVRRRMIRPGVRRKNPWLRSSLRNAAKRSRSFIGTLVTGVGEETAEARTSFARAL